MATTTTQTITSPRISAVHTSNIHRGPVTAKLNFYKPPEDGSAPFNYVEAPPSGHPPRNYSDAPTPIPLTDIRGHEARYTLDTNAFAALTNIPPSSEHDFLSDASVKQNYYPEVEALLLAHVPNAQRVLLFDHTIRRATPHAARSPVTRVHIDQTPASARTRVENHAPASEAAALLKGRYRIINVWRPINGAVESFPLAFADSASVPDEALVGIEHRYPDHTGETAAVRHTEGQRWCYWSGMGEGERLLLECYDSENERARVPHTAFVDPRSGVGARARESIEVRALVFG